MTDTRLSPEIVPAASRLVFQRVTLQPAGSTGWHTHAGPLLVVVRSGTLTHYDRHCEITTYAAGEAFVEPAGPKEVHMGANHGGEPVVLDVTYVIHGDAALRDDADPPACAVELQVRRRLARGHV